jgi:hypothetical protein
MLTSDGFAEALLVEQVGVVDDVGRTAGGGGPKARVFRPDVRISQRRFCGTEAVGRTYFSLQDISVPACS